MTELPDLAAALDAIDLQLVADSPEVVLPRDHAQLLAALLTDLLNPRGHACRPGTRAPGKGSLMHHLSISTDYKSEAGESA